MQGSQELSNKSSDIVVGKYSRNVMVGDHMLVDTSGVFIDMILGHIGDISLNYHKIDDIVSAYEDKSKLLVALVRSYYCLAKGFHRLWEFNTGLGYGEKMLRSYCDAMDFCNGAVSLEISRISEMGEPVEAELLNVRKQYLKLCYTVLMDILENIHFVGHSLLHWRSDTGGALQYAGHYDARCYYEERFSFISAVGSSPSIEHFGEEVPISPLLSFHPTPE